MRKVIIFLVAIVLLSASAYAQKDLFMPPTAITMAQGGAFTAVGTGYNAFFYNPAGFARKAVLMARAGIYDLRIHHDDIVMPLVRQWRLLELDNLDEEGERARDELVAAIAALDEAATRFVEQREAADAKRAARQG